MSRYKLKKKLCESDNYYDLKANYQLFIYFSNTLSNALDLCGLVHTVDMIILVQGTGGDTVFCVIKFRVELQFL